jgi:hypothetical protein
MTTNGANHHITSREQLRELYGTPFPPSLYKELGHINDHYRAMIELSPFVALATTGPNGLDCSPRGDAPGFIRVKDANTLLLPDRPGNNRTDTLGNILDDPRVSLLFLIPGIGETLRVVGRAAISVDPELLESFAVNGKPARSVLVITVESVFFHCSKAIVRSKLWDPSRHLPRTALASTGTMVAELSKGAIAAEQYDRDAPARIQAMLY